MNVVAPATAASAVPSARMVLGADAPPAAKDGKQAEPPKPPVLIESPEYDSIDFGRSISGSATGAFMKVFVSPHIGKFTESTANKYFPRDKEWARLHPYRSLARDTTIGFMSGQIAGYVSGPLNAAIQGALHKLMPSVATSEPKGTGIPEFNPAALGAGLVGSISKGMMKQWISRSIRGVPPPRPRPPAPPKEPGSGKPAPKPAAASKPRPAAAPKPSAKADGPPPPPPPPPTLLDRKIMGETVRGLSNAAFGTAYSMGISAFYNQTLGPIVSYQLQKLFGGKDVKPVEPRPLTPGKVANAMLETVLGQLLIKSVKAPPTRGPEGQPGPPTAGGTFAAAFMNGIINGAFSAVYGRSVGPAVNDAVNGLAGLPPTKRDAQMSGGERFARSVARGAVTGGVSHVAQTFTAPLFLQLGANLGGTLGPLVAMAGAALVGLTAGTAADALVGKSVGKFAAGIWSSLTGKPTYEQRVAAEIAKLEEAKKKAAAAEAAGAAPPQAAQGAPAGEQQAAAPAK